METGNAVILQTLGLLWALAWSKILILARPGHQSNFDRNLAADCRIPKVPRRALRRSYLRLRVG